MRRFAHIGFGGTASHRNKVMEKIKDRNPVMVCGFELGDNVITYAYEGEDMIEVPFPVGTQYYQMELDLDARTMYVHLMKYDGRIESVMSADGDYIVDYYWNSDGLPVVVGFELLNNNKVSIIQDWIEDGIESALAELNDHPRHEFEDDHWKGVLIRGET